MIFIIYAERPFQYRSSPHSCDLFNLHQGKMVGDESGASRRSAPRGQTRGLIKARPSQPQTGFEVRHIKSTGSKVRHRTDLHLTLQLEMVISRCNDDPCLTVRDDTSVGDTRHLCERARKSALTPPPWCIEWASIKGIASHCCARVQETHETHELLENF